MVDLELDELRREFLDEARGKVVEMQSVIETGHSAETLDRLAYLAHQLKGSGGSYGYQRISTDAAEIEKAAELLAEGNGNGNPTVEAEVQQHVLNLRAEIERCARELA
jgi:HPt (histidine-containing phosphotransfer) domain-containing protein